MTKVAEILIIYPSTKTMECRKIIGNIPGYMDRNASGFSSNNDNIDMVGIITLKDENIYITDIGGVTNLLTWNLNSDMLCSGLVIGIRGERELEYGRSVGAIVNEYYFPDTERIIEPLSENIYVCHSMDSIKKIDQIVDIVKGKHVYVLALSAGNQLEKVLKHAKTKDKMFHIMPHFEHDLCTKCLPISFRINIGNISSLKMPSLHQNILFVSEYMVIEMKRHTKLKTVMDMLSLIAKSGMVTPSNRISKHDDIGHRASLIICDTSEKSQSTMVHQTKIVMLSKHDILETNGVDIKITPIISI